MTAPAIITDELDVIKSAPLTADEEDDLVRPLEDMPAEDDELPEVSGEDAINLLAQSPFRLFLHWNHAVDPFAIIRVAFGDMASQYRLAIRLHDQEKKSERIEDASPDRAQWLDALPDRDYLADVGLHAEGLPFVRLLTSAVVHTPRAAVSPKADPAPEFHITAEEFSEVLEQTGYARTLPEYAPPAPEEMSPPAMPIAPAPVSYFYCEGINAPSSRSA